MAITTPKGEQIQFVSAKTGTHNLDTYLEAAEVGNRQLHDLLDDLFDSSTGVFKADNFQFRFDTSSDKLQVRVGQFANSTAGWADVTTFFKVTGTFSTSTSYNNFDLVTLSTKDVYIVHGLTSATTYSSESNFISSANTEKLVDVSEAKDWASKTDGQVQSTDYSSKAWAIGGTGVTDTASKGAAKEWATKTSGTVDGSDYSAKHWATTGNVAVVSGAINNINTLAGISANITSVAGISSDVTALAATDVLADMALLAVSDVISDMNVLAVADVISDLNTLATADVVNDMNVLGTSANVTNMNTLAGISSDITSVAGKASLITSDFVSDLNALAVTDVINDINLLATSDIVSDLNTLATSDIVSDLNTLATSDIVSDINVLATSDIVSDLNQLATSDFVSDLNAMATTANINSLNAVSGSISNVNTVATNISSVNDFADKYRIGSSDPSSSNDAGDLFYNTSTNVLKVYTGSAWENGVTAGSGFLQLSGGQLTGNITMSGSQTVDGRDLSADGTKLDAIEANATADQTAAEILTAIKTVDGAGSGLDADTLDGVEASALLPLSGGTMTGANKLMFGDSGTFIHQQEDGALTTQSDGATRIKASTIFLMGTNSSTLATFSQDGSSVLHHSNSGKISTTSTGVDVTGTVYSNFQRTKFINNGDWYDGVNWEWVWGNINTNINVWYKVADMVWPTDGVYDGGGFLIELITNQSNYGSSTEVASNHYNLAVNVSAGTAGSPDEAAFTGTDDNNFQLRAIKTAAGVYELQIKCTIAHRFAMLKVQMTSTAALTLTPTSSLVAGSTSGTAYLPAESGLATRLSHRFQRVEAATLAMGDNNKATFGDSDDLQIYHTGSVSVISEQGNGDLNVQTNGANIALLGNGGSEYMANFASDGAVTLYHNNSTKLATTSGGVHVTGALSATTSMTVQNGSGTEGVRLDYNENGGEIVLMGTSGNNKLLIDYLDNDDDGNGLGRILNLGAGTTGVQLGIANASNTGGVTFTTGNNVTRQHINSIGDIFSYATDGSTIGMFWDASENTLSFPAGSADTTLYNNTTGKGTKIGGDGRLDVARQDDTVATFNRTGSSDGEIIRVVSSGTTIGAIGSVSGDIALTSSANPIRFSINNSEKIRFGAAGQLGIGGANYGTSGQVLTSGGAGAAPSWADLNAGFLANVVNVTSNTTVTTSQSGTVFVIKSATAILTLPAPAAGLYFGIVNETTTPTLIRVGGSNSVFANNIIFPLNHARSVGIGTFVGVSSTQYACDFDPTSAAVVSFFRNGDPNSTTYSETWSIGTNTTAIYIAMHSGTNGFTYSAPSYLTAGMGGASFSEKLITSSIPSTLTIAGDYRRFDANGNIGNPPTSSRLTCTGTGVNMYVQRGTGSITGSYTTNFTGGTASGGDFNASGGSGSGTSGSAYNSNSNVYGGGGGAGSTAGNGGNASTSASSSNIYNSNGTAWGGQYGSTQVKHGGGTGGNHGTTSGGGAAGTKDSNSITMTPYIGKEFHLAGGGSTLVDQVATGSTDVRYNINTGAQFGHALTDLEYISNTKLFYAAPFAPYGRAFGGESPKEAGCTIIEFKG